MSEKEDRCDSCDEELEYRLDAYDVGEFMLCPECHEDLEEDLGHAGLALAVYLAINPTELTRTTYDESYFIVNRHRTKRGSPPSHFVENVAFLRAALSHVGLCDIQSKDELLALFRPPRWKTLSVALLRTAFPRKPKWAKTFAKRIRLDERKAPDRVYHTIVKMFKENPTTAAMMHEGIHRLVNTLYHVCGGYEDPWYHFRGDYETAFNGGTPPDRRSDDWASDGEYYVYTDEEADAAWDEYLEQFIDDVILPDVPQHSYMYFDREAWKRDARMDGRGHSLSGYDGCENEQMYQGEWYYIYRQN